MDKPNKWTITLSPLPAYSLRDGERIEEGTFVVSTVEVGGAVIRCTGASLVMSPRAPVALHLEVTPRDLEIIMGPKPTPQESRRQVQGRFESVTEG